MKTRSSEKSEQSNPIMRFYSLDDKLTNEKFEVNLAKEMLAEDLDMKYIKNGGFQQPLVLRESDGLGMKMPDRESFTVDDILRLVGKDRIIPVQKCESQTSTEMTLGKFCEYFNSKKRKSTLNMLSLEFSNTGLEKLVGRPSIFNKLDWIDLFFPKELKDDLGEKYPKVKQYSLISPANSYTAFHVDFGGTSVWYHVLKGCKIFWLIKPTDYNLNLFESWWKAGCSRNVFLGDLVQDCQRITLRAGNTILLPSGWIHAVYTPEDSIVFGGNFVHSFAIPMQLKISKLEKRLKIPNHYRFPLEVNLQLFVIEEFVFSKTGKSFLVDNSKRLNKIDPNQKDTCKNVIKVAINKEKYSALEVDGLKKLVDHLKSYIDKSIEGIIDVEELINTAISVCQLATSSGYLKKAQSIKMKRASSNPTLACSKKPKTRKALD